MTDGIDQESADERGASSREIRDRRKVVERVLEMLPPSLSTKAVRLTPGPNETTVIWSHRGLMIASCVNQVVAQFLADSPGYLRAFSGYIEQLEASAYHDRERRRQAEDRVEAVTNLLLASAEAGFKTATTPGDRAVVLPGLAKGALQQLLPSLPNSAWRY